MFPFDPISPVINAPPDLQWLGPVVTAIGTTIVGVAIAVTGIIRRRQDRQDAAEDRNVEAEIAAQPKITDGWDEVRKARAEATDYYNLYRTFEGLFYTVFSALRHLARRVRDAHPEQEFDKDIVDALAITPPNMTDPK